jgi:hypothetical protein
MERVIACLVDELAALGATFPLFAEGHAPRGVVASAAAGTKGGSIRTLPAR